MAWPYLGEPQLYDPEEVSSKGPSSIETNSSETFMPQKKLIKKKHKKVKARFFGFYNVLVMRSIMGL